MKFHTLAIHAGQGPDPAYGAVMTPIYQTSTFAFKGVNQPGKFDYSRSGNPTRAALESCLAALENGTHGFAFATGMAASATILATLSAGDHVLVHDDLYGGTYRLLTKVIGRYDGRIAGFDAEPVHEEVLVAFQAQDEGAAGGGGAGIVAFGGGDRRSPLWLSGPLEVR